MFTQWTKNNGLEKNSCAWLNGHDVRIHQNKIRESTVMQQDPGKTRATLVVPVNTGRMFDVKRLGFHGKMTKLCSCIYCFKHTCPKSPSGKLLLCSYPFMVVLWTGITAFYRHPASIRNASVLRATLPVQDSCSANTCHSEISDNGVQISTWTDEMSCSWSCMQTCQASLSISVSVESYISFSSFPHQREPNVKLHYYAGHKA